MNLINAWKSFWLGEDYAVAETITGKSNVTISSRVAQAREQGKWWGIVGCKALNVLFLSSDHCGGAITHDLERVREAEAELAACQKLEEQVKADPTATPGDVIVASANVMLAQDKVEKVTNESAPTTPQA